MKNIKRTISLLVIIISFWIIRTGPFYILVEYPMAASILMWLIIYLAFLLGLSTFSSKNRTLDNIRVVIMVLSFGGIFPGIALNYSYFQKAKHAFLLREGITGKATITDKKTSTSTGRNHQQTTSYSLYFSFMTSERKISNSRDVVYEKIFQLVNVGDTLDIIYLPKKSDIAELIITQGDRKFYAKKLNPNQ